MELLLTYVICSLKDRVGVRPGDGSAGQSVYHKILKTQIQSWEHIPKPRYSGPCLAMPAFLQ